MRVFLLSAGLVILAVVGAVLATLVLGRGVAHKAVSDSLERSAAVQSEFGAVELEQVFLQASTVAGDPNFVAYILQAMEENSPQSIIDQLDERQRDLGFDFASVLDLNGMVVARNDKPADRSDLSQNPLFLDAQEAGDISSLGLSVFDDSLYSTVLVPLRRGNLMEGFLLLAFAIDDGKALELRQVTGTEVTFLLSSADGLMVVATTLDADETDELVTKLTDNAGREGRMELELRSRNFLANLKPIGNPLGEDIGMVLNLGSLDDALAPYRRISNTLAGMGLLAILLALVSSFFLAKRLLEPIRRLADITESAAQGDLDQEVPDLERNDEVGRLNGSFGSLLSALRETRDMQVYLTELTRTLPDQEKGVVETLPATLGHVTLMGLELRQYVKPGEAATAPRTSLDNLTREMRRISRSVLAQGGSIDSVSGHRLLACFQGDRHAERALSVIADLASLNDQLPMSLVAATGAIVTGSITWQQKPVPAQTGEVVEKVEDLLRAGRPGAVLLAKSTFDLLASLLHDLKLQAQAHQPGWTPEPIYSLNGDQVRRLSSPEVRATVELTSNVGNTSTTHAGAVTLTNIGPGNVLGSRFEILSELGAGGMGVVFKARDQELNELVALKMLKHETFAGDSQGLENLKAELKLARKISHPNVLRTYDFGDADGFPFISMEFVRGVTLKHLLEQSGRLPLSAGLHMARQLCLGLRAAHQQSVLHRDIKPENMIIEPTGTVKLMDFGIAQPIRRLKGDETSDQPIIGTPYYLAPEQLESKEPDERADIYACGVVFYEIFTGKLPFVGGNNLMQIITQKMNEDPTPPRTHRDDLPPALEAVIMRCLERDREARYPKVDDLLDDLNELRR